MEVKQKLGPRQRTWVDALRSGKYEQGHDAMREGNKFCCLGVACDLQDDVKWVDGGLIYAVFDGTNHLITNMPTCTREYFGFKDNCGGCTYGITIDGQVFTSLMGLNDIAKMSFTQIADMVEADPANFFVEPR